MFSLLLFRNQDRGGIETENHLIDLHYLKIDRFL